MGRIPNCSEVPGSPPPRFPIAVNRHEFVYALVRQKICAKRTQNTPNMFKLNINCIHLSNMVQGYAGTCFSVVGFFKFFLVHFLPQLKWTHLEGMWIHKYSWQKEKSKHLCLGIASLHDSGFQVRWKTATPTACQCLALGPSQPFLLERHHFFK